jgi:ribosome-binding protein aMBF1 (putative translation factor)
MSHQDWKPVSISNPNKKCVEKNIEKRPDKVELKSGVKLDENDEVIKIKTVPREIGNLITNARITKKLTRKQLANNLNLKEDIIADIELGKGIYDGNLIAKIKKHLGVI